MALTGLASVGVTFGYGVESTAGEKPATFSQLTRINDIGGISIEPEPIDSSALEDFGDKSIAGRASTGGQFTVTINLTDDTEDEWDDVITAYEALTGGKQMWFETIIPGFTKGFFVIAQPPKQIPQPAIGQNGLITVEIMLTIVDYIGPDTKVAFT